MGLHTMSWLLRLFFPLTFTKTQVVLLVLPSLVWPFKGKGRTLEGWMNPRNYPIKGTLQSRIKNTYFAFSSIVLVPFQKSWMGYSRKSTHLVMSSFMSKRITLQTWVTGSWCYFSFFSFLVVFVLPLWTLQLQCHLVPLHSSEGRHLDGRYLQNSHYNYPVNGTTGQILGWTVPFNVSYFARLIRHSPSCYIRFSHWL